MRVARATSRLHNQPPAAMNKKHTRAGVLVDNWWQRRGGNGSSGRREIICNSLVSRGGDCEAVSIMEMELHKLLKLYKWLCGGKVLEERAAPRRTRSSHPHALASGFLFLCLRMWVMAVYENSLRLCSVRVGKNIPPCVRSVARNIRIRSRTDLFTFGIKTQISITGTKYGWAGRNARPPPPAGCNQTQKSTAAAAIGADERSMARRTTLFAPIFQDPYHVVWAAAAAAWCNIIFICGAPNALIA